jgi:hypothetical protein
LQKELSHAQSLPAAYTRVVEQFHFTVTQQNQLKVLLRRWQALHGGDVEKSLSLDECQNAKQVLNLLEQILRSARVAI